MTMTDQIIQWAILLGGIVLLALLASCGTTPCEYRHDSMGYYKRCWETSPDETTPRWHLRCTSATPLPDPATWTGGCR